MTSTRLTLAPSERDTYGVICKGATLTSLANGFCFGEGPRWFEGLLWFSDMLGEAVHTVNLHGDMTKLPLAGHAPSGLGFRPDGSLLIASTENRQVLRYDGDTVTVLADLSDVVPADLGDMVVDEAGRAYVGSQAVRAAPSCGSRPMARRRTSPRISPSPTAWSSHPTARR